jgi:hypothetical protein
MLRVLRGSRGETVFRGATISALAVLALFLLGIILSQLA